MKRLILDTLYILYYLFSDMKLRPCRSRSQISHTTGSNRSPTSESNITLLTCQLERFRNYLFPFPCTTVNFTKNGASQSCAGITKVVQWKGNMKAHRNFLKPPYPKLVRYKHMKYYSIVTEGKEEFIARMRQKWMFCPYGNRSFWNFDKHNNNNFVNREGRIVCQCVFTKSTLNPPANKESAIILQISHKMHSIKFKIKRLGKIIFTLDTNKGAGLDKIFSIFSRNCAPELAPVLSKLFHFISIVESFPGSRKTTLVQPV